VALRRRAQAAAQWGRTELPGEGPGPGWLPSGCQHARYVTEMKGRGKWPPPREAVLWTAPSVLSTSRARGTGGRGPDDAPRGLSVLARSSRSLRLSQSGLSAKAGGASGPSGWAASMGLSGAPRRFSGISAATARPLSDRAGRPPRARASEGKGHGGFQWGCRWQPEVGRGAAARGLVRQDTTPRGAVSSPDDQAAPCRELGHRRPGRRFSLNHTRHIGGHRPGMPLTDSSAHFRSARAAVRSASSLACSRQARYGQPKPRPKAQG
jgi:hypothetical protein